MIEIIKEEGLTFDDILLVPRKSDIKSRLNVNLKSRLYRDVYLDIPIISANMDTVTELSMLCAMCNLGGLGIYHRFKEYDELAHDLMTYRMGNLNYPAIISVGVKDSDLDTIERLKSIIGLENVGVCIDVAHGHHQSVCDMISKIRDKFGDIPIIAGNVCTAQAAKDLIRWGADAIKVGVGPGAACKTRDVAGVGVPQLTAIMEVRYGIDSYFHPNHRKEIALIADGGIKTSGDIVKALAAGADTVMLGSLLAGTDEAPGEIITNLDGERYKSYRGMASTAAMDSIGSRRKAAEGVSGLVPYKGSVKDIIQELTDGIRSGMSYLNCENMEQLHNGHFSAVKITQNGRNESVPHMTLNKNNIV